MKISDNEKIVHVGEMRRQLRLFGKKSIRDFEQPIITIDGLAASGKGSIAQFLAQELRWNLLDSGVLYRSVAYCAKHQNISIDDIGQLLDLALNPSFMLCQAAPWLPPNVFYRGRDITTIIRTEDTAADAVNISAIPELRSVLNQKMKRFNNMQGLIADGRDMGSVVFPNAQYKFFINGSLEQRALRRCEQQNNDTSESSYERTFNAIEKRDSQDTNRVVSPMRPANDAIQIDNTDISIIELLDVVVNCFLTN